MKRLNRINYFIYFTIFIIFDIIFILYIDSLNISLSENKEMYNNLFTLFFLFQIPGFILLIRRGHDIGKGSIATIASNFIPWFFIYLIFKEGDKGINKYGDMDNTILFMEKDTTNRKNIFEKIFYCKVTGPFMKIEEKDILVQSIKGRILVIGYTLLLFMFSLIIYLIFGISENFNFNEDELFALIILLILNFILYKFLFALFISAFKYIKG